MLRRISTVLLLLILGSFFMPWMFVTIEPVLNWEVKGLDLVTGIDGYAFEAPQIYLDMGQQHIARAVDRDVDMGDWGGRQALAVAALVVGLGGVLAYAVPRK